MSWRQERQATKAEERRLADRGLLDEALAPYLRDPADEVFVPAREPLEEPVIVTVRVAEGASIDLRRLPSRAAVVRLRRRPAVALAG